MISFCQLYFLMYIHIFRDRLSTSTQRYSTLRSMDVEKQIRDASPNYNVTFSNGLQTSTEKDIFLEQVESTTIFQVANIIKTYWVPFLVPVGLVGNTLSFLVMMKPNNRRMSTCVYMAGISINDNIMMAMALHVFIAENAEWHQYQPGRMFLCCFYSALCLTKCYISNIRHDN